MVQIKQKIVNQAVVKSGKNKTEIELPIEKRPSRPFALSGETYKLRTQVYTHAFYVTINDLNGKPFEMFINSKNNNIVVWIGAFTLMASAIFRAVPNIDFLVKEMLQAVDPMGGHHAHQTHHESIVAEIFYIVDCRMKGIPINKKEQPSKGAIQSTVPKEALPIESTVTPSVEAPIKLEQNQYIDAPCVAELVNGDTCGNTVWREVQGCAQCDGPGGCGFSKCG